MDKKRLRVALKVLEKLKTKNPETKDLIEDEFQKEKISVGELWGNSETTKKTKRLDKDEIKKQLLESITINNAAEIKELNERSERVQKPEDAADIITQCEEILQTKRKGISQLRFTKERFLNA